MRCVRRGVWRPATSGGSFFVVVVFLNPYVAKWLNLLSLWDYCLSVFEEQGTGGTGQSAQTVQDNSESALAAAADITNTDQLRSSAAETLFIDSGEVGLCSLQCLGSAKRQFKQAR